MRLTRSAPSAMRSGLEILPPGTASSNRLMGASLKSTSHPPARTFAVRNAFCKPWRIARGANLRNTPRRGLAERTMSIIGWIVLGLIAGWLGSKIFGTSSTQGVLMAIVLGIVGAVVGGFVF